MQEKLENFFHTPELAEKGQHLKESLKEAVGNVVNNSRTYAESIFCGGDTLIGFFFSILICICTILLLQQLYHIWTCQKTRRGGHVPILKTNWRPDIVYLFQFPRTKNVPNASPYCLKLETFLRHHKLPYEVIETMTLRSVEGKLPFIELNGVHYADSQLIICHLYKHFGLEKEDTLLTEEQKGMVRIVSRMLDHATFYQLLYFKLGKNINKFYETALAGHAPKFLKWLSVPFVYPQVWDKLNLEGTGLHSDNEVETILRADLKALNALLGEKYWLVGDKPTLADFTFFGHIASNYNLPYPLPIQRILVEEFPRLRALHDRMAQTYFPEFNFSRISSQENQAKEGRAEKLTTTLGKIIE